jgi:hypothetical protein
MNLQIVGNYNITGGTATRSEGDAIQLSFNQTDWFNAQGTDYNTGGFAYINPVLDNSLNNQTIYLRVNTTSYGIITTETTVVAQDVSVSGQIPVTLNFEYSLGGCTDIHAINYNSNATFDNNSCNYGNIPIFDVMPDDRILTIPYNESTYSTAIQLAWQFSDVEDGASLTYNVTGPSDDGNTIDGNGTIAIYTIPENTLSEGDYEVTITVTDSNGNSTSDTVNITINQDANVAPTITGGGNVSQILPYNSSATSNTETKTITWTVTNPEGDDFSWSFDRNDGTNVGSGNNISSGTTISATIPADSATLSPAQTFYTLTVTDSVGGIQSTDNVTFTMSQTSNTSPTAKIQVNDGTIYNIDTTINLNVGYGETSKSVTLTDVSVDTTSVYSDVYEWCDVTNQNISSECESENLINITTSPSSSITKTISHGDKIRLRFISDAGNSSTTQQDDIILTFNLSQAVNNYPVINDISYICDPVNCMKSEGGTVNIHLQVIAEDPDNDSLSYTWQRNPPAGFTSVDLSVLTDIDVGVGANTYQVTVTDEHGLSTLSDEIQVSVFMETFGCTDEIACNYHEFATTDNGTCEYCVDTTCYSLTGTTTTVECLCAGNANDNIDYEECTDGYSINPVLGCTDNTACNYDNTADEDDETCTINDCLGECGGTALVDDCGVCDGGNASQDICGVCEGDGTSCLGCTDSSAENFDVEAIEDNGSCEYLPLIVNNDDIDVISIVENQTVNFEFTGTDLNGDAVLTWTAYTSQPDINSFINITTDIDNSNTSTSGAAVTVSYTAPDYETLPTETIQDFLIINVTDVLGYESTLTIQITIIDVDESIYFTVNQNANGKLIGIEDTENPSVFNILGGGVIGVPYDIHDRSAISINLDELVIDPEGEIITYTIEDNTNTTNVTPCIGDPPHPTPNPNTGYEFVCRSENVLIFNGDYITNFLNGSCILNGEVFPYDDSDCISNDGALVQPGQSTSAGGIVSMTKSVRLDITATVSPNIITGYIEVVLIHSESPEGSIIVNAFSSFGYIPDSYNIKVIGGDGRETVSRNITVGMPEACYSQNGVSDSTTCMENYIDGNCPDNCILYGEVTTDEEDFGGGSENNCSFGSCDIPSDCGDHSAGWVCTDNCCIPNV